MATTESVTGILASQWPYITTSILACVAAWLLQTFFSQNHLSTIPIAASEVGGEDKRRQAYLENAKSIYLDGYRKFKEGVFRISTSRKSRVIVIHPRFLPELKNLPEDVVSFTAAIAESLETKYTKLQPDRPIVPHVIKRDLTPALNRLNPTIAEEVDQSFQDELPPCKEFTEVNITSKLLRIVAKVSGRIFIGTELCRSEEYIDAAINYTKEIMDVQRAVSRMAPWLRVFKAASLPEVKSLDRREKVARDFLQPIVIRRKEAARNIPDGQKPDDLLQWFLDDGQSKFGEQENEELASIQLGLTFAAIHTTTLTATNAFYNIAAMPELIPELREEIRTVLAEYGTFTTSALQKMKKLDSFLRETMRFHPLGWTSFNRKVLRTFALSNGKVIPAGCIIQVPHLGINFDPEVFDRPEEFDAFRAYRTRQKAVDEGLEGVKAAEVGAANQFVSISPNNLTFGYGRHSCPGRFFAANEIKMIVSRALLDYDIKNVDGSRKRIPNFEFGEQSIPDPTKNLMFKRIA